MAQSCYALTPYSTHELDELEKEFIQQINQSDSVIRIPLANQYINELGKKLAKAAHLPTPHFFIVNSDEINAFAGPGGYIGVNTRLIISTTTESELAGVMAHELAHVRLHHLYQLIEHGKQMKIPMLASVLVSAALGMINPALASGALMASLTGIQQDNINFIRSNEKEADRIGINMLIRAGFNPQGMADFFRKMQQNSRYYYTANIPAFLRTHPIDEDRIAEAESKIPAHQSRAWDDNLNYHLFKMLIRTETSNHDQRLLDYFHRECGKNEGKDSCQYGEALVWLNLNQATKAQSLLEPLANKDPFNLFYQIAWSKAEIENKQFQPAISSLQNLQANYPENYAVLMAYAEALRAAKKTTLAATVLLKGSRMFKNDLVLCETLAQVQAEANHRAFAYFTQAKCQLLQGRYRDAVRQLKLVKSMSKKDPYLFARADALIEEIKASQE